MESEEVVEKYAFYVLRTRDNKVTGRRGFRRYRDAVRRCEGLNRVAMEQGLDDRYEVFQEFRESKERGEREKVNSSSIGEGDSSGGAGKSGVEAVVLLSGGIDSTTCLAMATDKWGVGGGGEGSRGKVHAISFSYGQKHSAELRAAARVAEDQDVTHEIVELPRMFGEAGSTLVEGGAPNPRGTYESLPEGVSPTYVPYRNGTLLSLGAVRAASLGAGELWFGAHSEDAERWAYPDCTPEFIGATACAIWVGTYHKVRLVTPLEWLTKREVVARGLELGAPYGLTLSCYNGTVPACGECPTCLSRLSAFYSLGQRDPIPYVVGVGKYGYVAGVEGGEEEGEENGGEMHVSGQMVSPSE